MCLICQEESMYQAYLAQRAGQRAANADDGLRIAVESPLQDDVRALIADLNETLLTLTPAEFCYHMTVDEMAQPDTTVFVARYPGKTGAVACGALRRRAGSVGEVKRMYTVP